MKYLCLILIASVCFFSCKSKSSVVTQKTKTPQQKSSRVYYKDHAVSKTAAKIIKHAKSYEGTRYKYGGLNKRGIDCSGLIYNSFLEEDIAMPRTTNALSTHGDWVDVKEVKVGDLLFFATKKNSRKVNHVAIVTKSLPGKVEFIHSTTSRGVITSNLSERYWYLAYDQARRVL